MALGCVLLAGTLGIVRAESRPEIGPPFEEAQAIWKGLWTGAITGDLRDVRRYLHSERQHLIPANSPIPELQQLATQMAYCRLDPKPVPVAVDEVIYRVLCERGGETAESQMGLRRERDGTWRISVL